MEVKIEQSWKNALADEFEKPYFASLVRFLHEEKAAGQRIYPPGSQIFKAFELTPVDQVKVVILGQDPYHGAGQAMGLSFSVPANIPAPPSLKNIFKEIHDDLGITMSGYPDLEKWARQGVLLLNAVLTVRARTAGFAQQHRLDRVHGCRNQVHFRPLHRCGIPSVGKFRKKQESPYRHFQTLCSGSRPPVSSGEGSILRMQAFFKDE